MNRLAEVLPRAWPAPELPGYRDHPRRFSTYSGFSYDELPPIQQSPDEAFGWLEPDPLKSEWTLRADGDGFERKLREITHEAGITLPRAFSTFLSTPDLQDRIRSCTSCYLELPDRVISTIGEEDGYLIHFLSDQQWCLHWFLYVNARGEECVLCSPHPYGFDPEKWLEKGESSSRPGPIDLANEKVVFCAPSFREFLHRFWIENEIWFALTDGVPLTEEQRAYAEHYHDR